MADPWIPLLLNLPLSRTEREVVKRFESEPTGRTFLPVADILRAHRLLDESLELLLQGVDRHPQFAVARVVLVRELLQKGMVAEAWRALEDSPVSLRDNLLAQKLRFRLALLLGYEPVLRTTVEHLKEQQMLDADTKRLADLFEVTGIDKARAALVEDFDSRGTVLVLPPPPDLFAVPVPAGAAAGAGASAATEAASQEDQELEDEEGALASFHVVPLDEIFRPGDDAAGPRLRSGQGDGVELDSTTLADIYARQGHYAKALAVYRRMLRLTPNNDLLRRKVGELSKLDRDQRDVDLTVDPLLVDRMEHVEVIDRQMRFFNDLLSRLT